VQKSMRLLAAIIALAPALPYAQELRVFPPPAPVVNPIQGAIDFHVHSAPDVFGRRRICHGCAIGIACR
jgi:hypothetical protein